MGETYGLPEPEKSVQEVVAERAEPTFRMVVAGHPQGAVRRILLYILAAALVVAPVPALGSVPIVMLATTDQLA